MTAVKAHINYIYIFINIWYPSKHRIIHKVDVVCRIYFSYLIKTICWTSYKSIATLVNLLNMISLLKQQHSLMLRERCISYCGNRWIVKYICKGLLFYKRIIFLHRYVWGNPVKVQDNAQVAIRYFFPEEWQILA